MGIKGKKKMVVILGLVLALLLIGGIAFVCYLRTVSRQNAYLAEDLEEVFYQDHARKAGEGEAYIRILQEGNDEVKVFLGCFDHQREADYSIFTKNLISGRWERRVSGSLQPREEAGEMIQMPSVARIYMGLNEEGIARVTYTEDGEVKEILIEADQPFLIMVKDSAEDLMFFTEEGEQLTEEAFSKQMM